MPEIFEALPGIEVPVGSISSGLARMWEQTAADGKPAPEGESAMAIQVNLVLHLGFMTDAEDAVRQFETAVKFSRRTPSRVVVLCPIADDSTPSVIRAKVYGECSIGKSSDDTRCCEFVMLSYPRYARTFLENQVSICVTTDLPIYYWVHKFSDPSKLADYRYLLTSAKRVMIDTASSPPAEFDYHWPDPGIVRDLAFARLLPARRSIGQFLGRYPVEVLAKGLRKVRLSHGGEVSAEAKVMLAWLGERIAACGASSEAVEMGDGASIGPRAFDLAFSYDDARFFSWKADLDLAHAFFEADFGSGRNQMTTTISLLSPENALSEAMFF
jgi:hypothetical protein